MEKRSLLDYFLDHVERFGDRTAVLSKQGGKYVDITWKQLGEEAKKISAGLIALGVSPGDRINLISNTRKEWVTVDMGILGAGAVTVPIYPSNLPDECVYIVENSEAVVIFSEDANQTEKFLQNKSQLSRVKKVIQIDGTVGDANEWVMSMADLMRLGDSQSSELEKRRQSLNKDSILTIIYTSGTTGRPKGVVTTHDAMLYVAEAISEIGLVKDSDIQLLFLPLAHSFAKAMEVAWLSTRHVLAFAENMQTIKQNLAEVRPTVMAGVPRIYEKFFAAVVQKGTAAGGLKGKLFQQALDLSEKNGEAEMAGRSLGLRDGLAFGVLKTLVFKKVQTGLREILGGRMRMMVSGGAPLSRKIAWFFRDAGSEIHEGYGLTETAAATFVNRPGHLKIGTVGPAFPRTEVRIAEDGEILIKGRGVMREYWHNPEATKEVLKEGWFYTGDIGVLDKEGYLKITDRKKDIIVTAGGKNVAPQNIENLVKTNKLISQAVVHGDKRKYVSALITLDPETLRAFASTHNLGNGSYAELTQRQEVQKEIQKAIDDFNKQLPSYESIKKFKILEHDFTIETGELTPSLKIKRKVIAERYKKIFDGFYDEAF